MNYKLSLIILICVLFACQENKVDINEQEKEENLSLNDKSFQEGQIRIKLNNKAERSMQLNVKKGVTRTGLTNLDRLAEKIGASKIERVFPPAGKFEARTREAGLHLWYDVYFNNTIPVSRAIADFSNLPEIDIIEPVRRIANTGGQAVTISKDKIKSLISKSGTAPFNDPLLPDQWHYNNDGKMKYSLAGADINLFNAWNICSGDKEVIVAIVDGGIDYVHEDLEDNMFCNESEKTGLPNTDDDNNGYQDDIYGWNFVDNTPNIIAHSHGTHVAGTIAATNNNGKGVCGVAGGNEAKKGVRVMSCQIFKHDPNDPNKDLGTNRTPAAIKYGADNGAVISQNSWGYEYKGGEPPALENVVKEAIDYFIRYAGVDENGVQTGPMKGGILIFSAGNENINMKVYPAGYEPVLSVAAMAPDYVRSYYSNYGKWVSITAPGGSYAHEGKYSNKCPVLSTLPGNNYGYMQGTSMACPHVSGVAALVVSKFGVNQPGLTPDKLRGILLSATNDINTYNFPYEGELGSGYIDAGKALLEDKGIAPNPVTDLQVTYGSNFMTLKWSVTADEDNGMPKAYNVYWSQQSLEGVDSGNPPTSVKMQTINVDRKKVGDVIEFQISDLTMSTTYYVGVVGVDVFGNRSLFNQKQGETLINQSPIITPQYSGDVILKPNETRELIFDVTEPENETWTHVLIGTNQGISSVVKNKTIVVTIKAAGTTAGIYEIGLKVTDASNLSAERMISYQILANHAPSLIQPIPNVLLNKIGSTHSLNLANFFRDEDSDELKYTVKASEKGVVSTHISGSTLTITSLKTGEETMTINAEDGADAKCSATFTVTSRGESSTTGIDLYPNPVVDVLNIRLGEEVDGVVKVTLYNSIGIKALSADVKVTPFTPGQLNVGSLSGGTYTVSVRYNGKEVKRNIVKL